MYHNSPPLHYRPPKDWKDVPSEREVCRKRPTQHDEETEPPAQLDEETEPPAQDAEETEPPAQDAEETTDISADEGTAPSAAGHSWDSPAAQTAQMTKKRRKRKTIEDLMKENPDVKIVNCSVRENTDEDNVAVPKQKRKNKKRAADEAAAEAARKAARKAAAVAAFGPSQPAARAAENGDDVD